MDPRRFHRRRGVPTQIRNQEDPGSLRVDGERSMTKSELIELIAAKQSHLPAKDVELAVKQVLEIMSDALAQGQRIEIRGFGSFSLHFRPPRQGRNPKTGETVALAGKYVPHFKPGKDLRERVNEPDDDLSPPASSRSSASTSPSTVD
ncbi:MAG: integration host factor subunit beta [Steroidobacteraceae bacterium]